MTPALLLLDVTPSALAERGLSPPHGTLVPRLEQLSARFRALGHPVIHLQTHCARQEPHRERVDTRSPAGDAIVLDTRLPGAFGNDSFEQLLRERHIDTLVLAGCRLHASIRTTALDAEARSFRVIIADDAVASAAPEHAELSRMFLAPAVEFRAVSDILHLLDGRHRQDSICADAERGGVPAAIIDGVRLERVASSSPVQLERRMPSDWSCVLARVSMCGPDEVARACATASRAFADWRRAPVGERRQLLERWAAAVDADAEPLARSLATEVGKPMRGARAEVAATAAMIRAASVRFCGDGSAMADRQNPDGVRIRRRPHGPMVIITPWNNPLAIPAGKLAPAVALGNTVVWKPASEAPRTAIRLLELLLESGLPPGVIALLFGDAGTARLLMGHDEIRGVTLTGATATGRAAAVHCAARGIPYQAELGGNNAAIVLPDYDFSSVMPRLALGSFAFSGQRCTAIRRWVVHREIVADFTREFVAAAEALTVGDPFEDDTEIGPLVSRAHRASIVAVIRQAVDSGSRLLAGGTVPGAGDAGCWLRPAILSNVSATSGVANEETFGPLAMVIAANDFEHALELANASDHGLVAALFTHEEACLRRFHDAAEAGVLQTVPGPLPVSPDAPFGGWKASGVGLPEHGEWDGHFYTRPQALYAEDAKPELLPNPSGLPRGTVEPFSAKLSSVP
jgi:alpha-ketoglutaric semialdehyde dehydrogenase